MYRAKLGTSKLDQRIAWFHNQLGKGKKGDTIRKVLGAGPVSDQHRYIRKLQQKKKEEDDCDNSSGGTNIDDDVINKESSFMSCLGDTEEGYDDENDDDEEYGILPKKFNHSAFVESLRSSITSLGFV